MDVKRLISRFEKLAANRSTWESHWQDVTKYCIPRKAGITSKGMPGEKKTWQLYDATAIGALDILAAGMNTFLTSTVNKWFELKTSNPDLMESDAVMAWLQAVESRMYSMFNASNFSSAIHESYLDDGSIGTSVVYVADDREDICRFYSRHISECFIAENNRGKIDTVFRRFHMDARSAFQEWGPAVGDTISKAARNDPEKEFQFLHIVLPREDRDPRKSDRKSMPYASLYINYKTKELISEGGYHEFPYMLGRWTKGTAETYGRSPAMNALPDIKMVNRMSETTISAAQLAVKPPITAPDQGVVGSVRMVPAGITYVRADMLERGVRPEPMNLSGRISIGLDMENQRREAIRSQFFVDLFMLLMSRPTMTATEVIERNEEKIAILGPIIGRQMSEKLDPLIARCFGIMSRRGKFPEPPPELSGQQITVEYVSLLARVQKLYITKAISGTFQDVAEYSQVAPEIWDNIDPDQLFDIVADIRGFPVKARRSKEMLARIRQAKQEAAQQQLALEEAGQGVGALATAKKAGLIGGPNA